MNPSHHEKTFAALERMRRVNQQQKDFYESRYASQGKSQEKAANRFTNLWTWMRRQQLRCRKELGIQENILQLHRDWLQRIKTPKRRVLDLGCFSGNALSLELARGADSYLGVDLSEEATGSLNETLKQEGISNAEARAMDFLDNDFPNGAFDIIYAHSVLHHFQYFDLLLKELYRVCAPGGTIITLDPLNTSWSIRIARSIYRPFQSDKNWEFPFSTRTLRSMETFFQIKALQGIVGFAKYGMPLMFIPGCRTLGSWISAWGNRMDKKRATQQNFSLRRCLQITMWLEKTEVKKAAARINHGELVEVTS